MFNLTKKMKFNDQDSRYLEAALLHVGVIPHIYRSLKVENFETTMKKKSISKFLLDVFMEIISIRGGGAGCPQITFDS